MKSVISFPNYMQLRDQSWLPLPLWHVLRGGSIIVALALVGLLLTRPASGLFWLWHVAVPLLPLLFFVAPGIWRNLCPLAATNQLPRLLSFSRAQPLPPWLREYGYVVAFTLFFILASSRKWLLNESGVASALLILGALVAALLGGYLFKGKSGWCSSICPMLPVQRLYNQTPLVVVPNSHCTPCVGCTKNCYDFNPSVANLTDLNDDDPYYRRYRTFFAATMAGFVLAFYTVPNPAAVTPSSVGTMYGEMALIMFLSLGSFLVLETFVKVSPIRLTTLYGAAALNLYYWFNAAIWPNEMAQLLELPAPGSWLMWVIRGTILLLTANWIARTYRKETFFVEQIEAPEEVRISSSAARTLSEASSGARPVVTFMPDEKHIQVEKGRSLLEIAEGNDIAIEPGCRMGICGADPIVVLSGMENLSPVTDDELATLDRLGYAQTNACMACKAMVGGPVVVSLDLADVEVAASATQEETFPYDPAVQTVVIIGNGIAGVTAADHIRRRHPTCTIHLIGREKHHLYNRMGISRLIYGRSAMSGLYLLPETWYESHEIDCWLNTRVTKIDVQTQQVELAVGESLAYDRLILASGSRSFIPQIPGFGLPGTFALRKAEDAMNMRSYVQDHNCRYAVVAGGGLLGLEAAYALHKLGLHVTVLERSPWLLRRQLDEQGGAFLKDYLESLGLTVITEATSGALHAGEKQRIGGDVSHVAQEEPGAQRVRQIELTCGQLLPCDLFLLCAGIASNTELAAAAGVATERGVVVNEAMQSSLPHIYAAGDACQYNGQVLGLWPVAVEQAKVAAINAIGGEVSYQAVTPVTMLKVVGAELLSAGQFMPADDDDIVITFADAEKNRYRKLVIAEGRIVGAILFGFPNHASPVTEAIKQQRDVTDHLDDLRAGNWEVLSAPE